MARYVALWRGINVGKAKRLAMADLRALLTGLGATEVATLLNSGNAVFDTSKRITGAQIRTAVRERLGVDAAVILKTAAELQAVAATQPIGAADDPSRLLVAFTEDPALLVQLAALEPRGNDQMVVTAGAAYLWCADGILASQTAVTLLKQLGERGTSRNWATVEKLQALSGAKLPKTSR